MDSTARTNDICARLYVALELSATRWMVGMARGAGDAPRKKTLKAVEMRTEGLGRLIEEIERGKSRMGLSSAAEVVCVYEAGRDGFWIRRGLEAAGVRCLVIDAGSMRVTRQRKQRKTDQLDLNKLLVDLIRYMEGDGSVWSVVRVPSEHDEDLREIRRELQSLGKERRTHLNRIRGVLMKQGVEFRTARQLRKTLAELRTPLGRKLGVHLRGRIDRELDRLEMVDQQIREAEKRCRDLLSTEDSKVVESARRLAQLRGLGPSFSWVFATELFGWREFRNRRQVGSLVGLTGAPFRSGAMARDQGIDKRGNGYVRSMAIECSWSWLRHQPDSALSHWFNERFGEGKRSRRIGIVALARKLMIAFWRYVRDGVIPAGAELKPVRS